jgi:CPA2 family monovalent cation:H+ antiporter-2
MAGDGLQLLAAAAPGHGTWLDDFGIVLAAAGLAVAIFHILRLPIIFGYIIAGVLIGPNLFSESLVKDAAAVQQISELGVIFLLFFIGMEFDLKRLQRVFGPALISLMLQTVFMLYLAQMLAPFLGWNPVSTLFFGSLLAISSSMVTVRVLRDTGQLQTAPAQFTVGILILEDVLAVILLVILTGVTVTKTFDWDAAWLVTFLMGIFVVMVFVIGRAIVPRILMAICGDENEPEVMTLVSTGLVMLVSILALRLEFSPALGAFLAGTLLSQTQVAQTVERVNRSLHDVFSAVFFVSVGMQLNPIELAGSLHWILAISFFVIGGKILACWLGLCLAGQSGKTALMAAIPKAQIGEFSFIIAGLGSSLGVLDGELTRIAFGVALVTILLTPPLSARREGIFKRFLQITPKGLITLFETYQKFLEGLLVGLGRSVVLRLIRRPVLQIIIYFFIINGLFITASYGASWFRDMVINLPWSWALIIGYWLITGLAVSPFLIAVLRNLNAMSYILTDALFSESKSRTHYYRKRLRQMLSTIILGMFIIPLFLVFLVVAAPYLPDSTLAGMAFLITTAVVVIARTRLIHVNSQMEYLFIQSFRAEVENKEDQRRMEVLDMIQKQTPWPVDIVDLTLPQHAAWSGKQIRDLDLRSRFGVNILAVGRRYTVVYDPPPEAIIFSGDRLVLSGSPEAIQQVGEEMEIQIRPEDRPAPTPEQFRMEQVYLEPHSELAGQTLAGGSIRRRFGVTVIGIQRGEERIGNPGPDFLLAAGDVLAVAGLPEKIEGFASSCGEKPLPDEA